MNKIAAIVIDDSEADRYLASRILSRSGRVAKVTEFRDGAEAVDFFERPGGFEAACGPHPPPTLVLLDINMPRMDGFQLLDSMAKLIDRGLLDRGENCVVMMLTSSAHSGDRQRAFSFELVKDYIEKPLSRDRLEAILKRHYPDLEIAEHD